MRTTLAGLLIALALIAGPTRADDNPAAKQVITAQVEALGRDDAATAFSYAAPAIKGVFDTPEVFMAMVRQNYVPIYRHKSFTFGVARAADGKIAQQVDIVDMEGVPWVALYTLEQLPDGSVKITGCVLKAVGQST